MLQHGDRSQRSSTEPEMNIPAPEKLVLQEDAAKNEVSWNRFNQAWDNYVIATGLSEKDKKIQLATFLSVIGEDGILKYNIFKADHPEESKDID